MNGPARIGVVLSSGGGRGVYAHTGFLLALRELGIETRAIAGCSAGALVGAVAASGTELSRWAEVIANVHTKEYWKPDPWPQFLWELAVNKGRGYTGLSRVEEAIDFCRRNFGVQTFEECRIPFYTLAMNLTQGKKVLFSEGELAPRVMASAAMPVLYRPVEIDGELYTDGAVIELAPTEAICCQHSLDALIVHHAAVHHEGAEGADWVARQPWALVEILDLLLYRQRPWYITDQPLSFHRCPGGCGAPIIVLTPKLPELVWPLHDGGTKVQMAATMQARKHLEPYLQELKEHPRSLVPPATAKGSVTCHDLSVTKGTDQDEGPP